MNMVKTGDICPICGQRVMATDPEALETLSAVADMLERLGVPRAGEERHHEPGDV